MSEVDFCFSHTCTIRAFLRVYLFGAHFSVCEPQLEHIMATYWRWRRTIEIVPCDATLASFALWLIERHRAYRLRVMMAQRRRESARLSLGYARSAIWEYMERDSVTPIDKIAGIVGGRRSDA